MLRPTGFPSRVSHTATIRAPNRACLTHGFYGPRPHISRFSRWLACVGMLKSRSSLNELERNFGTVLQILRTPDEELTKKRGLCIACSTPPPRSFVLRSYVQCFVLESRRFILELYRCREIRDRSASYSHLANPLPREESRLGSLRR